MRPVVTLLLGLGGGLLGEVLGVPAGALLGAMAAVGAYNLVTDGGARVSPRVRPVSRALVGATLGSLATPVVVGQLGANLGWSLAFTVALVLVGVASGLLLWRLTDLDLATALLSCCPGGITEMTALAEDLGAHAEVVLGVHVVRKLVVLVSVIVLVAAVQG